MEDRRAHERIDELESVVGDHINSHEKFEQALEHNTALTKEIADNTAELVQLVRGAKGLRTFIIWSAPIAAALAAALAWIKAH